MNLGKLPPRKLALRGIEKDNAKKGTNKVVNTNSLDKYMIYLA